MSSLFLDEFGLGFVNFLFLVDVGNKCIRNSLPRRLLQLPHPVPCRMLHRAGVGDCFTPVIVLGNAGVARGIAPEEWLLMLG
ncbi:hypothetical protein HAX54_024968, partial [Datura stramonium]|nr:hypothetical protein [Datura stramonium]